MEVENSKNSKECKVKVAARIRPLLLKEINENCSTTISCNEKTNEIFSSNERSYKFDKAFSSKSSQDSVYKECASDLINYCFEGYNCTIIAYGQTSSGKTYTMGTFGGLSEGDQEGIIPRVLKSVWQNIEEKSAQKEFMVKVSFLEIYNEEIYDLLERRGYNAFEKNSGGVSIREERDGTISLFGLTEEKIEGLSGALSALDRGSLNRTTNATLMNAVSSRSHAVFTITIEQHELQDLYNEEKKAGEDGFICSKFHFVDLAGSERLKKTGASGAIMKEGININKGLLALGNVIAALTDKNNIHTPYRDSKLTRILQDSLGGNARTWMIACVSPASSNIEESISTLNYASRARQIKNKPHINTDPNATLINQLRQEVFDLKSQLMCYRKGEFPDRTLKPSSHPANNHEFQALKSQIAEKDIVIISLQKEKEEMNQRNLELTQLLENSNIEIPKDFLSSAQYKSDMQESYNSLQTSLLEKSKEFSELEEKYNSLIENSESDQKLLLEKTKNLNDALKLINRLQCQMAHISDSSNRNENNDMQPEIEETFDMESQQLHELEQDFMKVKNYTDTEYSLFENALKEKEELIQKISHDHLEHQEKLVSDLRNEYFKKIKNLERELNLVEKQKNEAMGKVKIGEDKSKVLSNYKNKLNDLEYQLKDFKRKEKEQEKLEKIVNTQKGRLENLNDEVRKIKTQKVDLLKRVKEENDKYEKLKGSKLKEILEMKKTTAKKDALILKLKHSVHIKDISLKRQEEKRGRVRGNSKWAGMFVSSLIERAEMMRELDMAKDEYVRTEKELEHYSSLYARAILHRERTGETSVEESSLKMQTDALEEVIDNLRKKTLETANKISKQNLTIDGWKKEDIPELFYKLEKVFIRLAKLKSEKYELERNFDAEIKNLHQSEQNLRVYIAQKEYENSQLATYYEKKIMEMSSFGPFNLNFDESSVFQGEKSKFLTEVSMLETSFAQENISEPSIKKVDSVSKKRQGLIKTKASKEKKKISSLRDRQKEAKMKEGKSYQSKNEIK